MFNYGIKLKDIRKGSSMDTSSHWRIGCHSNGWSHDSFCRYRFWSVVWSKNMDKSYLFLK